MPGSTISICNEPDEFEAALRNCGRIELIVTHPGQFRSRLVRVALSRLSLLATEEYSPRIGLISPAPDTIIVVVPLDRQPSQIWAGLPVHPDVIITISGRQLVHARTNGPCRTGIIYLKTMDFARYARALLGRHAIPLGLQQWRPVSPVLRSLTELHNAAVDVTAAHPATPANADAARGLEQELITALVDCLSIRPAELDTAVWQRHVAIMARFEAILRTHPNQVPTLVDICAALGVSERTFRTCCYEHLGMGPSRYIRLRRLQRIHRALKRADISGTSISDLALRYGVREPGRFAASYRDLFGELPSATMRRAADLTSRRN